jgi:hypothetical protein
MMFRTINESPDTDKRISWWCYSTVPAFDLITEATGVAPVHEEGWDFGPVWVKTSWPGTGVSYDPVRETITAPPKILKKLLKLRRKLQR